MNEALHVSSINQEKTQVHNRALVLSLLRQEGVCSRATLARLSGLKQATITNIAGELLESGAILETGLISGEKGRRSIGVTLNDEKYKVLGVRMTRKAFFVSLVGLSGKLYSVQEYGIGMREGVRPVISRIRTAIQAVIRENPRTELLAACVAMPGPYREDLDRLLFVTELEGWQNFPLRAALSEGLGMPLYVLNDANASAYAQLWYRCREPGVQNMIYILAGQGIGCGMISDGKLVIGQRGIAGEFGHNSIKYDGPQCECGNRGCLEKYCSMTALREGIAQLLRAGKPSLLTLENLSGRAIAAAIRSGDPVASESYRQICDLLATGIVSLVNQLNPGLIVIGDELAELCPDMLLDIVKQKIQRSVNPLIYSDLSIEMNHLPESPSLLGAGAYAVQQLLSNPTTLMQVPEPCGELLQAGAV